MKLILKLVQYTKVYSWHISKTIHAPLGFVYDWCTNFRETDPKITASKQKRKILLRTKHRVIYTESYRSRGRPSTAVDVVTLFPPKGWHLDYVSDEDDEAADYTLTFLGPQETKFDITSTAHFKVTHAPSKARYTSGVSKVWDKYSEVLEKDYRRSRH